MRKILILSMVFCLGTSLLGQEGPKREFRGAWVTTVWGLDWPSSTIQESGNSSEIEEQKQQFIGLIETLKAANINSVFFQVRSECDAMYDLSPRKPYCGSQLLEP